MRRAWVVLALLASGCEARRLETVKRVACSSTAGELARPTGAFLDFLGFNLALDLIPADNAATTFDRLTALGVRHLRTNAWSLDNAHSDVLAELDRRGWGVLAQLSIDTDVAALLRNHGARLEAIQIASPMNDIVPTYPVTRLPPSAEAVRAVVDAAATKPAVVAPLVWNEDDARQIGDLSRFVDLGGFRATIGLVEPSRTYGPWTDLAFSVSGGKPLVAVKGSWPATDPPMPSLSISERRHARWVTRLLLEAWIRGVLRTYPDQLEDPANCAGEGYCFSGLLRADGTPKPAYVWWSTMVSLLSASPAQTARRRVPLAIAAPSAPEEVHHALLEAGDGAVWLALWLEVRGSDADDVTRRVTIDVGLPLLGASAIDLRAPTPQPLPVGAPLELVISDAPTLVRLEPACL
jgi:hypothetical protein